MILYFKVVLYSFRLKLVFAKKMLPWSTESCKPPKLCEHEEEEGKLSFLVEMGFNEVDVMKHEIRCKHDEKAYAEILLKAGRNLVSDFEANLKKRNDEELATIAGHLKTLRDILRDDNVLYKHTTYHAIQQCAELLKEKNIRPSKYF